MITLLCIITFLSRFNLFVTLANDQKTNYTYRRSMLLSGNEPISPIPTGSVLPGISYFNKIYNMLDGTDLLEKPGRDIFTFRYSNTIQTWTSEYTYLVPVEFTGVPNLYPQCTKDTSLTIMKEVWNSKIITEKLKSKPKRSGFSLTFSQIATALTPIINVAYPPIGNTPGLGTSISQIASSAPVNDASSSIQNGNSRNTRTTREKRKEGYTRTYELSAESSLYEAEIAWDKLNHFSLKTDFQESINNLEISSTNNDILKFIYLWGTHIMKRARMGAVCSESVYIKSLVSGYDYENFYTYTKEKKSGILFWKKSSTTTTTMTQSGNFNNQIFYEFNNIRCEGECYTTQPCGGMTGQGFWLKPVEYELIPIWSIDGLLTDGLNNKLQLFVANIMKALLQCRINHCNKHGICTLREDIFTPQFVSNWDGITFDNMIDYNRACYCDDGYTGDLCTSPPTPAPSLPAPPTYRNPGCCIVPCV